MNVIQKLFLPLTRQLTGDCPTQPVTRRPLFQREIGSEPIQPLALLPVTQSEKGFIPIHPEPLELLIRMLTGLEPHQLEILPDLGICILHRQELADELAGARMLVATKLRANTKTDFERDFTPLRFISKV
jgi:hypothetical protein